MTDDNIQKTARTARSAIADLVEAAMDEKRVDGQGVHYWSEVAKHSMARNDTLISQLKEKEKIAAEQEQRIASLQNEILNQVYAGTQDDLKAEESAPVTGKEIPVGHMYQDESGRITFRFA